MYYQENKLIKILVFSVTFFIVIQGFVMYELVRRTNPIKSDLVNYKCFFIENKIVGSKDDE